MQAGRWAKWVFSVFLLVCLSACALQQRSAKWLIVDGCMIEISGITVENWDSVSKNLEIRDDCTLVTDTETGRKGAGAGGEGETENAEPD